MSPTPPLRSIARLAPLLGLLLGLLLGAGGCPSGGVQVGDDDTVDPVDDDDTTDDDDDTVGDDDDDATDDDDDDTVADDDDDTEAGPPTIIYALRHAEKVDDGSNDPDLTAEGHLRAQALAERLQLVPLDGAYSSQYQRTRQTLQPTADDHGLTVVFDIDPEETLGQHIMDVHRHQTVIHCGHRYSLPGFFAGLGWQDGPEDLGHIGYGDLWILTWEEGVLDVTLDHFGD